MSDKMLAEGSHSTVLSPELAIIRAIDAYMKGGSAADRLMEVLEDITQPYPKLDPRLESDEEDSLVVAIRDCASGAIRAKP